MKNKTSEKLSDGDQCKVVGGTHAGKSGTVRDVHTSKTGHLTITVEQKSGVRFKTLARMQSLRPAATRKKYSKPKVVKNETDY